ncbi:hypothetical protein KY310_03650 [Candidatus Woesearchaeota archaeon]|nr:hypothetical protein [Candidatus Woesearchaeota archaeon]
MEKENALEKMLDAYQKVAKSEDLPAEVSLALYAMLAEQLPEDQRSGLYAGLSLGYAKLAGELSGDAKDNAMAISQMYMAVAASQYQSIIQAKQKYAAPAKIDNYKAAEEAA